MARGSNQLRIISGELGGRLINSPKTEATHPMGDRERSAIFNRLRDEIPGMEVLDAFAGSGALGIEALSLGASKLDFLEKHPEAIRTIKNNLQVLNLKADIYRNINECTKYDIIFIDPPYDNPQYDLVREVISHLKENGYIVLSHPASPIPPEFEGLELISDKKYASAHIKIYKK